MFWFVSMALAVIICGGIGLIALAGTRHSEASERSFAWKLLAVASLVFVLWAGLHTALKTIKPPGWPCRRRLPVRRDRWAEG